MADYIFDSWKELMTDFRQSVQKDLEEIHAQKQAVQEMKAEIFSKMEGGKYYRDPERIVLSAPEIVIGNVDYSGDLMSGTGTVTVKGTNLVFDGVGSDGSVVTRAPKIRQTAVNPGIDGQENVVCSTSEIVSQACGITIESNHSYGAFSQATAPAGDRGGIRIHADQNLELTSALSCEGRKSQIEATVESLDSEIQALEKQTDEKMASVEQLLKDLKKMLGEEDELNQDEDYEVRLNTYDISAIHQSIEDALPQLYHETLDFIRSVSQLAEANRTKKVLEAERDVIPESDTFRNGSTLAQMSLVAEQINMATLDGDGCMHTNATAGVNIRTPQMDINMTDGSSKLVKGGGLNVTAENVTLSSLEASDDGKEYEAKGSFKVLSKNVGLIAMDYQRPDDAKPMTVKGPTAGGQVALTAQKVTVNAFTPKDIEYDDNGQMTKGEIEASGDVIVRAKNFTVEAIDYEAKDGKMAPKCQTEGSSISLRTEKLNMLSADKDGKATGSVDINAKAINLKTMDVDKEKLTDNKLAEGGSMTIVSEKMYVGATSKDVKSKKLQMVSEEIGAFADNTLEMQQGDGKAVVQLDGGNASVGGSKTQIYGATTINDKTEVKGELKAPKVSGDSIEAKSAFKSPNISDGMSAGAGGGGGSLSAKLKAEDAPKEN